jgi:anaerobic magnesium-protoporphyrin IX monomethyl ester cyclase
MGRKRVLLVTPPYHSGVVESAGTWLNLGFVYLAASLRAAGFEVEIYDAMSLWHDHAEILRRIEALRPDVVAAPAITAMIVDALGVLESAKQVNPTTVTVLGNVHPTFCWQEILERHPSVPDFIVRGEGEATLVELLQAHFAGSSPARVPGIAYREDKKAVATPPRPFCHDLDALPAAWDLVHWPDYTYHAKPGSRLAIVSSSRGCKQGCRFCSQQLFWRRSWRARSPEHFVAELEHLHRTYGVNVAMLADEYPTLDRERWIRILDLLTVRRLEVDLLMETRVDDIVRDADILSRYREAGVVHIYVGVESTRQGVLDRFNKAIKVEESLRAIRLINAQDIVSETSFVLGMPDDTTDSIRETVELAKYYDPDMAFFLAIAPWPYAEMYAELRPFIEEFDYRHYNLVEPVVRPLAMTRAELAEELGRASREFYAHKLAGLDRMSSAKRQFMLTVLKILATNSYLACRMKGIGEGRQMPAEVRTLLTRLGIMEEVPAAAGTDLSG